MFLVTATHVFLHRAGHRPESDKTQEGGQVGRSSGWEWAARLLQSQRLWPEAPAGVNTEGPTKVLKVAEPWRGGVGAVK